MFELFWPVSSPRPRSATTRGRPGRWSCSCRWPGIQAEFYCVRKWSVDSKNDENKDKEDGKGEFLLFHTKPTFIKRGKSSFIRSFTLLFTVIISWPIYSQHFNKIAWESLQGIYVGRYTSKQLFRPTLAKQRNFKFKPSLSQQFLYWTFTQGTAVGIILSRIFTFAYC